jgi:hypothetical protein
MWARPTVIQLNIEKHKYGIISQAGFENAMRARSPRKLQTARPLNLGVYK